MKHIIFVAGLALALSYPVQAQEKKDAQKNPPVAVDTKKMKIERPDAEKAKQAEKDANKKPAPAKKGDPKAPPPKPAEKVHCDVKKDPKCQNVIRKPKSKEEREAEKSAEKSTKK